MFGQSLRGLRLFLGLLPCLPAAQAATAAHYANYDFSQRPATIDVGCTPLAVPSIVVCELLRRDRLLQAALPKRPLRFQPFEKGPEVIALMREGKVDVTVIGDLPVIEAASRGEARILGLARQGYISIVGPKGRTVADLKGQRIGFVPGTSSHFGLLQALAEARLTEQEVKLVPTPIGEIADALVSGRIDAFSLHEPIPSGVVARYPDRFAAIYKNLSSAYLIATPKVLESDPELRNHLAAALVRAVRWMRKDRANLQLAARWAQQAALPFAGKDPVFSDQEIVRGTRDMLLDIREAPALPRNSRDDHSPAARLLEFMRRQGKLPATAQWSEVSAAFDFAPINTVLAAPKKYRIDDADYVR